MGPAPTRSVLLYGGSRAPSGRLAENSPPARRGFHRPFSRSHRVGGRQPSWALLPFSACGVEGPLLGSRSHRLAPAQLRLARGIAAPPRSGHGVFHALAGLLPSKPVRACCIPVTLLGFGLQGLSPRSAVPLSRPILSCRYDSRRHPKAPRPARLQRFSHPSGPVCLDQDITPGERPIPS